jgi:hypothetical protein
MRTPAATSRVGERRVIVIVIVIIVVVSERAWIGPALTST